MRMKVLGSATSWMVAVALSGSSASAADPTVRYQIPSTVSPKAAADLKAIYAVTSKVPPETQPTSLADWDRLREALDKRMTPASNAIVARLGVGVQDELVGGVPGVRIRPANYKPNARLLIYFHGGGYTRFSAHSRLGPPALIAAASGDEVISVDYTVAPRGNWRTVTDQVVSVWRALLAEGHAPASMALFGDSAGGGIAAGSTFKMRDLGLPLPGALYLMSPSVDVTQQGDSYLTLANVDPVLDPASSAWGADAYADKRDQTNPYVSAVYGDYAKAFPPTLIQGGTREMLLSNYVREYQAIRGGGHEAVLDLYEGMPHVFLGSVPDTPEARTAIARAVAFLNAHLR